ncbi:MAG: TonB-dependent receptor [Acidobacteria bacterium]|nr:TonB-dependent receptor [Acidobacteriota bacterium]MDA1233695.1 TonB-dependent receptor [Acidobacteriota bacterium]
MKNRNWITAALLTLLFTSSGLRADSVKGRVVDPQGLAVANARLQLFDRNSGERRRAVSDAEGAYKFVNLAAGDYLLDAEAQGAAMTGSQEIVVRGDETLDVELTITGADVEVIVTSSSTPLLLTEVAKAVDVIDSEEMAMRNEFVLSEVLRSIPGVRVRQLRGPGSTTTLQTRGMRSYDTALLIDGMRFRDAAGTQGDASALYQDLLIVDTERVEFMRGSGSSLYGSHAMAGVINVNSSQGGGKTHGEIRAEGGGLGMVRGVARVGGGLADDRFVYSGGFSHLNVQDGYRSRSPHRNTSAQGFAKYQFTPKISVSGRLWGADVFTAQADSAAFPSEVTANFPATGTVPAIALPIDQVERYEAGLPISAGNATFVPSPIDPDSRRVSAFLAGALILQHQLTANSSYRIAYQGVDTNRSFQDGPAGLGDEFKNFSTDAQFDGRTATLQARTDHRVGANQLLTAGYEFEREEYYNFNTNESPNPATSEIDIEQRSHAVFGQDQIRLVDGQLHLSVSGRAQFFETGTPSFSGTANPYDEVELETPPAAYTGDAALAYFFRGSQTKLRAHGGNSYRAPSSYERFGAFLSPSFSSFYGDPRLSAERSIAVDAGIDQWLFDSKVRLSGTFFYTELQETVVFDFANFPLDDPFGRFGGYANGGGGIARGLEVSGDVSPTSSTRLRASYTLTNSDSRTPRIGTDFFGIPSQSDHIFSVTATQWITRRFQTTFDLFAASDYSYSPFGAMSRRMIFNGPLKADVVFSYTLPLTDRRSVEFYGKVENVLNRKYYENGFGSPGAWAIGGMRFKF